MLTPASLLKAATIHLLLPTAALLLLSSGVAFADTLDYTFTGVASGTITGTTNSTFSSTSFTLTSVANTDQVADAGGGYYDLYGVTGTFTEGAYTATLADVNIVVNDNSGFENVNFYNAAFNNGLGLQNNPALLGYMLVTPVSTGAATGGDLETTFNGGSFLATDGDSIQFTGVDSLAFTVNGPSPAPEPSTWVLLGTGLFGAVTARFRMRHTKSCAN